MYAGVPTVDFGCECNNPDCEIQINRNMKVGKQQTKNKDLRYESKSYRLIVIFLRKIKVNEKREKKSKKASNLCHLCSQHKAIF